MSARRYPELKAMAHRRVHHDGGAASFNTTALVHGCHVRPVKGDDVGRVSWRHFMACAAHVLRSVVLDFVRQANAQRRGGDQRRGTTPTRSNPPRAIWCVSTG